MVNVGKYTVRPMDPMGIAILYDVHETVILDVLHGGEALEV